MSDVMDTIRNIRDGVIIFLAINWMAVAAMVVLGIYIFFSE